MGPRWLTDPLEGKTSLGRAFWVYGLGISVAYSIVVWLLSPTTLPGVVVSSVIGLAIGIVQSVILWRCAPNSRSAILGRLVRAAVVFALNLLPVTIYVMIRDPQALLPP